MLLLPNSVALLWPVDNVKNRPCIVASSAIKRRQRGASDRELAAMNQTVQVENSHLAPWRQRVARAPISASAAFGPQTQAVAKPNALAMTQKSRRLHPALGTHANKVVLVVDDEFLIRWSLSEHFDQAGYKVIEAETLLEARAALLNHVDVVLLDVLLPDGNGLDLLKELRRTQPDLPVIVISAHATQLVADRARADGAFDCVRKPFDLNALTALVDRAASDTAGNS